MDCTSLICRYAALLHSSKYRWFAGPRYEPATKKMATLAALQSRPCVQLLGSNPALSANNNGVRDVLADGWPRRGHEGLEDSVRTTHLCPGLSVNLSRSGPSLTLSVRGAHATLGRDRITKTVGLPGTGIFYTSRQGTHTGYHSAKRDAPVTPAVHAVADRAAERMIGVIVRGVIFVVVFLLLRA
jgi:hypothetical protein